MKLRSVSFDHLMEENPDLAASIVERQGLIPEDTQDWYVLFLVESPNREAVRYQRLVTTALITRRPIEAELVGLGVSLKGPDDENEPFIGAAIALARATRSIKPAE